MSKDASETSLLRCFTAGSVDDGKSTLIGRLLYDTRQVLADQLAHVEAVSKRRGFDRTELALLTDGLRAEREQGITIDVAWRYFATAKRKFVLADTPGHVQYTRNMVTGASTADVALILVDARNGLVQQSRRHSFLSRLLGIRHFVVCVNKMDLVGYERAAFERVVEDMRAFAARLGGVQTHFVPVAALHGDNLVTRSASMPWYEGPTLLELLESLPAAATLVDAPLRFPVQWVQRPQSDKYHDYRGYAGTVASGILRAGDKVRVLPAGHEATVARVETWDGPLEEAWPPMAVTVHLAEDLDVSRGELLVSPESPPFVGTSLRATLCWMSAKAPGPRGSFLLKHTTRTVKALLERVEFRYDVDSLAHLEARPLGLNDIAVARLRTASPLAWDPYEKNRATGSFVLIDEATHETVAGGMLLGDEETPLGG